MTEDGSLLPTELEARLHSLSPRPWISDRIREWISGDHRVFVLSGGPGTGKTMMAALTLAEQEHSSPGIWAASYFCSSRLTGFSRHPRHFISHLQECLLRNHADAYLRAVPHGRPLIDVAATISAGNISGSATGVKIAVGQLTTAAVSVGDYFQTAIIEPLEAIRSMNPGLLIGILVDGLDDALQYDGFGITSLIHEYISSFPVNCKVLLTSQNDPLVLEPLLAAVLDISHVDLSEPQNRAAVSADLRSHARSAIARYDLAEPSAVAELSDQIATAARGNFLHAESLVRELASGISTEGDVASPEELEDYYLGLFRRLERLVDGDRSGIVSWRDDCLPLLYLLAATQAPVPYSNLIQILDKRESVVYAAVRAVQTFLQVNDASQVGLEHQYVAHFLFSPTLRGHRANRYGVNEATIQEMILRRIAALLDHEWHSEWKNADKFTVTHLPGYIARLQVIVPSRIDEYLWKLRPAGLVQRLTQEVGADADSTNAMGTLLRVLRTINLRGEVFSQAVLAGGASSNPYIRAVVLDVMQECSQLDPVVAESIVLSLLRQANANSWQTGFSAMMSLGSARRNVIIRWAATKGPKDLRRQLANILYLLVGGDAKLLAAEMLGAVTEDIAFFRPNRSKRAIDFVSDVSITAYINNCDDPEVTEMTSTLWKRMTIDKLHLNILNRRILERPIVSVAAKQLASRVVELFSEQLATTEAERVLIESLLPGLVPGTDVAPFIGLLDEGFSSGRWVPRIISGCVTAIQATSSMDRCHAHLDELFEISSGEGRIWQIAAFTVLMRKTPVEWAQRLENMLVRVITENCTELNSYLDAPRDLDIDLLFASLPLTLAKHRMEIPAFFWGTLADADPRLSQSIFDGLSVTGLYYPAFTLSALEQSKNMVEEEIVHENVVRLISRMSFMHRTLVDVFIRETGRMVDLATLPEAADIEFVHRYVNALGLYNNAVHQGIYYPLMRTHLLQAGFIGLAESADAAGFVRYFAPRVLRLFRDANYELIRWTM